MTVCVCVCVWVCVCVCSDLAIRNLLLHREQDGSLVVKIADFGLSRVANSGSSYIPQNTNQFCVRV